MTGRLDLSLSTLDTDVVYFHSFMPRVAQKDIPYNPLEHFSVKGYSWWSL